MHDPHADTPGYLRGTLPIWRTGRAARHLADCTDCKATQAAHAAALQRREAQEAAARGPVKKAGRFLLGALEVFAGVTFAAYVVSQAVRYLT